MSLDFDLVLACDLRPDAPAQVVATVRAMIADVSNEPVDLPNHPFFAGSDWRYLLRPESGVGAGHSSFERTYRHTQRKADAYRYVLTVRTYVRDDLFYSIYDFLEWLAPYADVGGTATTPGFIGYYREEFALHPTLIYFRRGRVYLSDAAQEPLELRTSAPWPADGAKDG